MKQFHQCCSAAVFISFKCLQTSVDDGFLHILQKGEKQSSRNLFSVCFLKLSIFTKVNMNAYECAGCTCKAKSIFPCKLPPHRLLTTMCTELEKLHHLSTFSLPARSAPGSLLTHYSSFQYILVKFH